MCPPDSGIGQDQFFVLFGGKDDRFNLTWLKFYLLRNFDFFYLGFQTATYHLLGVISNLSLDG